MAKQSRRTLKRVISLVDCVNERYNRNITTAQIEYWTRNKYLQTLPERFDVEIPDRLVLFTSELSTLVRHGRNASIGIHTVLTWRGFEELVPEHLFITDLLAVLESRTNPESTNEDERDGRVRKIRDSIRVRDNRSIVTMLKALEHFPSDGFGERGGPQRGDSAGGEIVDDAQTMDVSLIYGAERLLDGEELGCGDEILGTFAQPAPGKELEAYDFVNRVSSLTMNDMADMAKRRPYEYIQAARMLYPLVVHHLSTMLSIDIEAMSEIDLIIASLGTAYVALTELPYEMLRQQEEIANEIAARYPEFRPYVPGIR